MLMLLVAYQLLPVVLCEKVSTTSSHQGKVILFGSFSSFVIFVILLHCCLKHHKLRAERRRRACLDCEEEIIGLKRSTRGDNRSRTTNSNQQNISKSSYNKTSDFSLFCTCCRRLPGHKDCIADA